MNHQNERDDQLDLIDLGSASNETKAMTYGADDSKAGLWLLAGLTVD